MRLTAHPSESLAVTAGYVNRRNPDGVVRWTDAPLKIGDSTAFGTENPFCAGASDNPFAALPGAPARARLGGRCGADFRHHLAGEAEMRGYALDNESRFGTSRSVCASQCPNGF